MIVPCESCRTEYEFDDALVSSRGTSVRCTNCGHEFRVFRQGQGQGAESWRVRNVDGTEYDFRELRQLQQAILTGVVTRRDWLLRDGVTPRELGAIPELQTFFDRAGQPTESSTIAFAGQGMARGVPAPARGARTGRTNPFGSPPDHDGHASETIKIAAQTDNTTAPPPVDLRSVVEPDPPTRRHQNDRDLSAHDEEIRPSMVPTPSRAVYGNRSVVDQDSGPGSTTESYTIISRTRRSGLRWMVGIVAIGAIGVAAAAAWRAGLVGGTKQQVAITDNRISDLLNSGDQALAEGDLDEANDRYTKASVLAEKDLRVLTALSRVAAAKADVAWLKLRILPAQATDARSVAAADLAEASARARKAAEKAVEAAPEDSSVIRIRLDALRLAGDRNAARALAPKVATQSSNPEAAYALAALELCEDKPSYTTVIERLRLAASAEKTPSRARAALVYALVRAGDNSEAKAELTRLSAAMRPHPLLAYLKAYVDGDAEGVAKAAASATSTSSASVAASALPVVVASPNDRAPRNSEARPDPRGPGEFSEEELHRALNQHAPKDSPAPTPSPAAPAPPPQSDGPHIDTSDLPGLKVK